MYFSEPYIAEWLHQSSCYAREREVNVIATIDFLLCRLPEEHWRLKLEYVTKAFISEQRLRQLSLRAWSNATPDQLKSQNYWGISVTDEMRHVLERFEFYLAGPRAERVLLESSLLEFCLLSTEQTLVELVMQKLNPNRRWWIYRMSRNTFIPRSFL